MNFSLKIKSLRPSWIYWYMHIEKEFKNSYFFTVSAIKLFLLYVGGGGQNFEDMSSTNRSFLLTHSLTTYILYFTRSSTTKKSLRSDRAKKLWCLPPLLEDRRRLFKEIFPSEAPPPSSILVCFHPFLDAFPVV